MVAKGTKVSITEETKNPFEDHVKFTINPEKKVSFPLYLRVPSWCDNPAAFIKINNGEKAMMGFIPGEYIKIEKTWEEGDVVTVGFPMKLSLRTWEANKNSVSVDYGPLTFSLKMDENYVQDGDGTEEWPAWSIYPASPWNFGLVMNGAKPSDNFEVLKKAYPSNDMPFTQEGAPIEIKAKGKIIPEWGMDSTFLVEELPLSPVVSDQPIEEITLIPMGAARLRISSFPVIR